MATGTKFIDGNIISNRDWRGESGDKRLDGFRCGKTAGAILYGMYEMRSGHFEEGVVNKILLKRRCVLS